MVLVVRAGVRAQRLPDGRIDVVLAPGTAPLTATEREMLDEWRRDAIIGGDACGQWRASQARWDGQHWCCPVCGQVLTFPF